MKIESINQEGAQKASFRNYSQIKQSTLCGCFSCMTVFNAQAVKSWTDDNQTAQCPLCQTDSVIGDASGYSINKAFLRKVRETYFGSYQQLQPDTDAPMAANNNLEP